MVVKAPKVKESPEAVAARRRAEREAEDNLVSQTRRGVTAETAAILRRFGIKAAMSGSPAAGGFVSGGFGGGFAGGGGGGSYNPAAWVGFGGGANGGGSRVGEISREVD